MRKRVRRKTRRRHVGIASFVRRYLDRDDIVCFEEGEKLYDKLKDYLSKPLKEMEDSAGNYRLSLHELRINNKKFFVVVEDFIDGITSIKYISESRRRAEQFMQTLKEEIESSFLV